MSNTTLRFIALCNGVQCALHASTVAYVAKLYYDYDANVTVTAQVVTNDAPASIASPPTTIVNSTGASKSKSTWF